MANRVHHRELIQRLERNDDPAHVYYFYDCCLGPEEEANLANALRSNTMLKELMIGRGVITDKGVVALAGSLLVNNSLEQLQVSGNNIRDEGAAALAKSLRSNRTLKTLGFWNRMIPSKGAVALAASLLFNSSLERLHLGIIDKFEGAEALKKFITFKMRFNKSGLGLPTPQNEHQNEYWKSHIFEKAAHCPSLLYEIIRNDPAALSHTA